MSDTTIENEVQSEEERQYIEAATKGMDSDDSAPYQSVEALGQVLLAEFTQAERDRQTTEQRWLMDLRQYRGQYDPDTLARIGKNRSQAFVRATRVKIKTVDARVSDLLFPSTSDRNWTAEPTPNPSLDKDTKLNLLKSLAKELGRIPTQQELDSAAMKVAEEAAKRMTKVIDDQLAESRYKHVARDVLHSGHLYGTGVLKAPLVERKVRLKNVKVKGKWKLVTETFITPFVDFVPLWRFYPDMNATRLEDCRYVFERHVFTRSAIADLAKRKSFKGDVIRAYILTNPKGHRVHRNFDSEISEIGSRTTTNFKDDGLYEVLERWGYIDGNQLRDAGVEVPENRLHETFFANTWLLPDGQIIKIALQPLNGVTWPYHLYYTDKDETSIFGDGFSSIMRDDQQMINAATRMLIDHSAITAGVQLEVNMDLLSASERADEMHPFKIWKRNGKEPNTPAIRVLNITNGLEELAPIINMFKENADDVTAIPRYMQGENATQGAAGTASGMSMLMASASIVMKDLITNYDEGVTRPFIEALYRWNMQFNPDDTIKGDFDIKARGTASLMAKEIRAQQLDQFAAATANPTDAPFIKTEELLRQRAEAHDLSSVVKTEEEVKAEKNNDLAKQQQQLQQQMQELQMKEALLNLQKMQAETQKVLADVERIRAIAVKTNVDAAYAGMQAGGVATERPEIAPAGDAILHSAGWIDKTPTEPTPQATMPQGQADQLPQGQQDSNPLTPPSANVGANAGGMAGINTPQIEGDQV